MGHKVGQYIGLTILTTYVLLVWKSGSLNFLEPSGLVEACNGIALAFYQAVLHTIHAEPANNKVSYVGVSSVMG